VSWSAQASIPTIRYDRGCPDRPSMDHERTPRARLLRLPRRRVADARVHGDDAGEVHELVELARGGSRSALGELFDVFHARVYRYVRARTASVEDAEDAVTETFLTAWKALPRYEWTGAPFLAWLLTIARTTALGQHRRAASRPVHVAGGDELLADVGSGADETGDVEQRLLVREYLATLPERQRAIVTMRFYGGLGAEEIGLTLGMSAAAVRQQQLKALERLAITMRREQAA
jgi:RNA polymerase sigma-70 factor (ECF subfamily)